MAAQVLTVPGVLFTGAICSPVCSWRTLFISEGANPAAAHAMRSTLPDYSVALDHIKSERIGAVSLKLSLKATSSDAPFMTVPQCLAGDLDRRVS